MFLIIYSFQPIDSKPIPYQSELSTALGVGDEKSYGEIVKAIGRAAEAIRSTIPKTQKKPRFEDSKETFELFIAAHKRTWKIYLRNQNSELWLQY